MLHCTAWRAAPRPPARGAHRLLLRRRTRGAAALAARRVLLQAAAATTWCGGQHTLRGGAVPATTRARVLVPACALAAAGDGALHGS
jgi:hypothetical protein